MRNVSRVYRDRIAPTASEDDARRQAQLALGLAVRQFNRFWRHGYVRARAPLISAIARETGVAEDARDIEDHSTQTPLPVRGVCRDTISFETDPLAGAVFRQVIVPDHGRSVPHLVRALRDAFAE